MTTRISPALIQSVVADYISILSARGCADVIGRSEWSVYKAKDPLSGIKLNVEEYLALDAAVGGVRGMDELPPFLSWASHHVRGLMDQREAPAEFCLQRVVDLGAAVGEVFVRLQTLRARADAPLSHNERCGILAALRALSQTISAMERAVTHG